MASPTLKEAKDRAIAEAGDDVALIGTLRSATTVEEIEVVLKNFGYSESNIDKVVTGTTTTTQPRTSSSFPTREENIAKEEARLAEIAASEGSAPVEDTGGPPTTTPGIDPHTGAVVSSVSSDIFAVNATTAIPEILNRIAEHEKEFDLTGSDWNELRDADTEAEAIETLDRILIAKGIDNDAYASYQSEFGVEAKHEFLLVGGDRATENALRNGGYEGDFMDNHDVFVKSREDGGFGYKVQIDVDNNLYYIDPAGEVHNTDRERVGQWKEISQSIDFMGAVDDRAPIGIGTGAYGTSAEGLLNVNAVGGHPLISLRDWYDLYGDNLEDVVTGKDWSDVLFEATGMTKEEYSSSQRDYYGSRGSGIDQLTTTLHYQYLAGDDLNMMIDMAMEDFTQIQLNFESLNIGYKAKKYGRFDTHLVQLVNRTMQQANWDKEGDPEGFEEIMGEFMNDPSYASNLRQGRSGGGTSRVWRPPAYLEPDYAEISQAVKLTFEQKMGRSASDAEIAMLAVKMKTDHRAEFDASTEAQKLQFFGSGGKDAGTVQDVSYAARFQEDFASRYSDELGTIDKVEQSRNITQNALGSILSADRAIGY